MQNAALTFSYDFSFESLMQCRCMLSWWCSDSASDSWSKGRWFDTWPGRYQVNYYFLFTCSLV